MHGRLYTAGSIDIGGGAQTRIEEERVALTNCSAM